MMLLHNLGREKMCLFGGYLPMSAKQPTAAVHSTSTLALSSYLLNTLGNSSTSLQLATRT